MRFALIQSPYHATIGEGLFWGANQYLNSQNISSEQIDVFSAPGAFEMPLLAKKIALTKKYSGVICLGCVIKGDTAHFEFISLAASMGIMNAMLDTEVPIAFGILTTYTEEQALQRARKDAENKGKEAAKACLDLAITLQSIR